LEMSLAEKLGEMYLIGKELERNLGMDVSQSEHDSNVQLLLNILLFAIDN